MGGFSGEYPKTKKIHRKNFNYANKNRINQ